MSDTSEVKDGVQPSENAWPYPKGRDWLLAHLVDHANSLGINQGITLNVGGTIITGTLISNQIYFSEMADLMKAQQVGGERGDEIKEFIVQFYEEWERRVTRPDDTPEDALPPVPGFIHLRDARFLVSGAAIPANAGVLWRGRLSSVDGFTFGSMTTTPVG